jgi:outer membrane protein OmpA-like peptidoglycan-associated protein
MRKLCTIALASSLLIATAGGCSNTGKGALIGGAGGGALGAGIGALAGGGKGAIVGGAVGAAVGAGTGALIGHYMDKQQEDLQQVSSANVERQGDQLVVRFNSAILFDTGKADLKPQSQKDLADFSQVLMKYPETDLVIEGHTDSTGTAAVNNKLSEQRAQSVVSFLQKQGVANARMQSKGYGETMPIGDNKTEEGRAQNRRVQIKIAANEELKKKDAEAAAAAKDQPAPAK